MPKTVLIMEEEIVKTIDGVTFRLRPEEWGELFKTLKEVEERLDIDERIKGSTTQAYLLAKRVKSWEGPVRPDGTPVEPTIENVTRFFALNPHILTAITSDEASDAGN